MKKTFCFLLTLIIFCPILLMMCGCSDNKDDFVLPDYLYNSNGEYVAFCNKEFLYDKETRKAVAQYDYNKKVFYDNSGYFGEIYNNKYILYNKNSKYKNDEFPTKKIAPIPPIKGIPANAKLISMPLGYKNCFEGDNNSGSSSNGGELSQNINLSLLNYSQFGITVTPSYDNWAGFYVYFNNIIDYDTSKYEIITPITINFSFNVTYKGYLKTDYNQTKNFSSVVTMTAYSNYTKRESIYNLQHKNYCFYEVLSSHITITNVSGTIKQK